MTTLGILADEPPPAEAPVTRDLPLLLLGGLAAFSAYFAMYAFRKPLAVCSKV